MLFKRNPNHQEDVVLQVYVPNKRALKYVRQNLIQLKGEIDKPIIILVDINSSLSIIGISSRQKNSKNIVELNSTWSVDIYSLLYPTGSGYILFSNSQIIHQDRPYSVHKTNFNNFLKIYKLYKIYLNQNGIKLEINNKKITGSPWNNWRLKNTLLNNMKQRRKSQKNFFSILK